MMPRQQYQPVILADTTRLTFPERLEYQKLGIMADELPTIYLDNQMEKTEYKNVLGLFLEKMSRKTKAELDEMVCARLEQNTGRKLAEPELPIFGINRRPVIDVNEDFELPIVHSYTVKRVMAKYLSIRFSYSISIQCFSIASKQQNEATYIHYTLIRALFCETTML